MTGTLAVIAKSPQPGLVKTRLCPPCSPRQAADLARAALIDTLAALVAAPARRHVVVLDGEPGPWLPEGIEVIEQRGDGLAVRLANAFADIAEPTFLIGMDTPQVSPRLLSTGLLALSAAPSVIGASHDGGYWGIGLRRPDARVFSGVPMSLATTGAAQRARLAQLGYGVWELPPQRDVDTIADARLVAAECPTSRFAATLGIVEAEMAAGTAVSVGAAA